MKEIVLKGIPAAPGIITGKAFLVGSEQFVISKTHVKDENIAFEIKPGHFGWDIAFRSALPVEDLDIQKKASAEIRWTRVISGRARIGYSDKKRFVAVCGNRESLYRIIGSVAFIGILPACVDRIIKIQNRFTTRC